MAFTGVAALFGAAEAGAAISAGMVLSAVAEVGTAMTVVGAVTGSKDLMKVGGIMGAVGGIGSFMAGGASAVGAATADGSDGIVSSAIDGSPSSAVDDMGITNPTDARLAAGTQSSPMAQDLANGAEAGVSPGDITAGPSASTFDPFAATDPSAAADGLAPMPSTDLSSSPVASVTASSAPGAVATPPVAPPGSMPPGSTPTDYRLSTGTQTSPMPSNAPQDTVTFMNRLMSFMQDPKNKSMLQMGEKLVGGAFQGMQQEKQFQQTLDLQNRRLAQTSYGSQVGQNRPLRGIVNGARQ
jgi:hypothetical protein